MKRFGNPWFILVCGLVAMATYGYCGSVVAMAAIGSPFFAIAVGVAMLVRYGRAGAKPTRQPGPGGQKIISAVYIPLLVGGFAYLIWSRVTETGLIGWLDAVQARSDGEYDAKLSLLVGMFYLAFLTGAVVVLLSKLLSRSAIGATPEARATTSPRKQPNYRRQVLYTGLGMFVAVWAIGFGVYEYYTVRGQREMQADYQPVDVAAPVGAASGLEFVALHAKQHPAGYLSLHGKYSNDGTDFIPLVAPTARGRDVPVHWVLESSGSASLPQVIRGHAIGTTLSLPTREAFARMGVRLADDVILVSYVAASPTGAVSDGSAYYWPLFIYATSFVSGLTLLFFFVAWLRHPVTKATGFAVGTQARLRP